VRTLGEETPSEPESSGDDDEEEDEDEEEGKITPSLPSLPLKAPPPRPSLGDLFSQQAGISIGLLTHHHSPVLRWYILSYRE
jgi:hypothetical protein